MIRTSIDRESYLHPRIKTEVPNGVAFSEQHMIWRRVRNKTGTIFLFDITLLESLKQTICNITSL